MITRIMARQKRKRSAFSFPIRITPFRKGVANRRLQQRLARILPDLLFFVNFLQIVTNGNKTAKSVVKRSEVCYNSRAALREGDLT